MPKTDPKGFRCPRCASRELEKSLVIGLGQYSGSDVHGRMDVEAFRCKKCHLEFTVWG